VVWALLGLYGPQACGHTADTQGLGSPTLLGNGPQPTPAPHSTGHTLTRLVGGEASEATEHMVFWGGGRV
jgi:hypothetical protein